MKNLVLTLSLVFGCIAGPACLGQETKVNAKKKKADPAKQMVDNLIKSLEPAALTAEQKKEIEELFGKTAKEVAAQRKEAEMPGDIFKKRAAATKEAREAGKKGAELQASVNEKLGLNEKQIKCWKETTDMLAKAKLAVGKILKEEQMAKIEEGQFKNSLTGAQAGGKKKKKSDA